MNKSLFMDGCQNVRPEIIQRIRERIDEYINEMRTRFYEDWKHGTLKDSILNKAGRMCNDKSLASNIAELVVDKLVGMDVPTIEQRYEPYINAICKEKTIVSPDPELSNVEYEYEAFNVLYCDKEPLFREIMDYVSKDLGWGCEGCEDLLELNNYGSQCEDCVRAGGAGLAIEDNYSKRNNKTFLEKNVEYMEDGLFENDELF